MVIAEVTNMTCLHHVNNLLNLFIEIICATNEKNVSLKVDTDVIFPVPLLRCCEFGTCNDAHRFIIQMYGVHFVLPK